MNKLILITALLTATLSAEWQMMSVKNYAYIYNTKTGVAFKVDELESSQVQYYGKFDSTAKGYFNKYDTPAAAIKDRKRKR